MKEKGIKPGHPGVAAAVEGEFTPPLNRFFCG
jgi:hypothetical protein